MRNAIILAAGKGTRMVSDHCKTMHELLGEPIIGHIYDNLRLAGVERIVAVVGYKAGEVKDYLGDKVEYVLQQPQNGSGDAVKKAEVLSKEGGKTLIVNGDCPLIQPETYEGIFKTAEEADLTVMSTVMPDPNSYGRIIREPNGDFAAIKEDKDCDQKEKQIKEINAGIYCVDNKLLWQYLPELTADNAQHEFYITQLVEIFNQHGKKVNTYIAGDYEEMIGINNRMMLADAGKWLKHQVNLKLMRSGITIIDPERTYLSKDTQIGMDSIIYPNVITEGKVKIGKNCKITANSYLKNVEIGDDCVIDSSELTDTIVGNETTIGPDSHLRNGCKIGDKVRIGNFVELKNTSFGYNTKCAHLTYVGDSTVGAHVNFGCGVVTVNYDGKNKFHTVIDDGAFIGSNVNIIAPVHVGTKALLAAGSTITGDVEAGDMGIARSRQEIKKGYGDKYLNK